MEPAQRLASPSARKPAITVQDMTSVKRRQKRGKRAGSPAQHGAREAGVSHDRSLHLAPIALQDAFGDVAEEALVVVEKAAGGTVVAVVVGLALGALGVEV